MAACSEVEEKPSSSEEHLIYVENSDSVKRKNSMNISSGFRNEHETLSEMEEGTKTDDLKKLSDVEFLHLLEEASTFNKSSEDESVLLKQLRKEVEVTESTSNVSYVETNCPSKFVSDPKTSGLVIPFHETPPVQTSQRTKKSKLKNDLKSSSNTPVSNPNRSQSLKDLSVDLTKSKKSHRTLSLSSEESFAIISDPSVISKANKKSYKQFSSNSSKSELNKSSRGSSKVPQNSNSVITLEVEDINTQEIHSGAHSESLPYQLLVNETDISLPSSRLDASSEKNAINCPIEIEMDEFKSDNESKNRTISCDKELKSKIEPLQSNSKFYVSDVDTTVAFPLKALVSNIEDQNVEGMNDQIKRGVPVVPWPRPLQVQSFFGTMPMETDSFNTRNDKQLLATDINGNPFARSSRPSPLTSFVQTTLLDYSNSNISAETKNRKNKRAKNSVNKGVLSESIEGYRGNNDIDSLLEYINSSDKKNKSVLKNTQNQLLLSKNSILNEHDKKKSLNKDSKSQKNLINIEEKKLTRSSSLENIVTRNAACSEVTYSYEAEDKRPEFSPKKAASYERSISIHSNLDVNSNVESRLTYLVDKNKDSTSIDESCSKNMGFNSSEYTVNKEVSGFAADFYSTADQSSQTFEEAGFLPVKKKQRKKQIKRSDGYRWRNTQIQRKKGMMLPLSESKCGKQDSRRKSTSSVPHSEHASANNSDSDSVHSLPVAGSVPHPTKSHPHTTPSSSSSTPQASYADIARMPNSKLNSPAPCIMTLSEQSTVKQQCSEQETEKLDNSSSCASIQVKRRVSDSKESSTTFSKASSHIAVEEKDSDCSRDVKVRTQAKSTREINTQTEPISDDSPVCTITGLSIFKRAEETNICNNCLLTKSECCCLKSNASVRQKTKNANIPAVIMDVPPEGNACNVSFGFGVDEVLQMTPSRNIQPCAKNVDLNQSSCTVKSDISPESAEKCGSPSVNRIVSAADDASSKPLLSTEESKPVPIRDLVQEQSSQYIEKEVTLGSGKIKRYKEYIGPIKGHNNSELTKYLEKDFEAVTKEIRDARRKGNSKMVYYHDISR